MVSKHIKWDVEFCGASDNEIGCASAIPTLFDHIAFSLSFHGFWFLFLKLVVIGRLIQTLRKIPRRIVFRSYCVCFIIFKMAQNSKESIATLNKQFESIFVHSNEIDETIKYLKSHFRRLFIRRCVQFLIFLGILALIYSLVCYIPILNWNASAIGRLALIKIILPAYNWQYLYNSRCLIEMSPTQQMMRADNQEQPYGEFDDEECTVCESLGNLRYTNSQN